MFFFNKDIEMSYSLCLKSLFSKVSPVVVFRSLPSSRNVFFLHYHENLSLEVVLRVRKCTHMAMSLRPGSNEGMYEQKEEYADDYAN